jgi:2-iminobutanoate/2-iminopropanoate deaminase
MQNGDHPLKRVPSGATQHVTAGPYSPVLEVDASRLVVLSGQVAVDLEGNVVGKTVEEQTEATLANCQRQLSSAGCALADVFKVNVYLSDLAHWTRFNAIYEKWMPAPRPVRTAVQAILLEGFHVEIEMWAVKARGS